MEWLILIEIQICISTATGILYVLPDNSTDAVSCPSQPCATLSQYLLDNGTLPVVSNVEYHFLPGEHHVPANMILESLHNLSIIGIVSKMSSQVMLLGCSKEYVMNIVDSHFITISNVKFKHCSVLALSKIQLTNLRLSCCFSCKIQNVTFLQYGLTGYNLIGESYLHNIKFDIIKDFQPCCQVILLRYSICLSHNNYSNYVHHVIINQLLIHDMTKQVSHFSNAGLHIHLERTMYLIKISLKNSHFYIIDRMALQILGTYSPTTKQFFITSVMPLDVLGRTRATLIEPASLSLAGRCG